MSERPGSIAADCTDAAEGLRAGRTPRTWMTLAIGAGLAGAVMPLDPWVSRAAMSVNFGGDLKREMEFIQQFGAITSCVLIALVILLLDPGRRNALGRAVVAIATNSAAMFVMKCLIGRPRPRLKDPYHFGGPWTVYQIPRTVKDGAVERTEIVARRAWEFWEKGTSDLWSLPSSHTGAAFALAAVLSVMYPRLRPLVIGIGCVVGVCRVALGAHYPSDVFVGGAIGWTVAMSVMTWHRRSA